MFMLQRNSSKDSSNRCLYCSRVLRSGWSLGSSVKVDSVAFTSFLRADPQKHINVLKTRIVLARHQNFGPQKAHKNCNIYIYNGKSRSSAFRSSGFLGCSCVTPPPAEGFPLAFGLLLGSLLGAGPPPPDPPEGPVGADPSPCIINIPGER